MLGDMAEVKRLAFKIRVNILGLVIYQNGKIFCCFFDSEIISLKI